MEHTPAVSIVMVSYRTGEVLYSALASSLSQNGLKELFLVDNGNSPETIARLEEIRTRHPQLQLISGHGNIGFARGCNLGASRATGEFILLLNPDCILPEDAIKQAVQALGEHKAMLVGANIVHPDGTPQRGARRHLMTPRNVLSECLHLSGFTGEYVNFHNMAMPDAPQVVPAISGAFMLMRRSDYVKLGGLDEDYFLHMEDMDLCLRVSKAGGNTLFLPQVKVVHHLSTSDASSAAVEWHKTKGFLLYFDRYHQASTPAWMFLALKAAIYARFALRVVVGTLKNRIPRGISAPQRRAALVHVLNYYALSEQAETYVGRTILVTGGATPLGACVIGRLLSKGAEVLAPMRGESPAYAHPRLNWLKADFTRDKLPPVETLIHCAPLWFLPERLADFVKEGISRVVAFGSTSRFTKETSDVPSERELAARLRQAEDALFAAPVQATLLRPTMIYGAGLDKNVSVLGRLIRCFHIVPVCAPAKGLRAPVHMDDLANAAIACLGNELTYGKAYDLEGGERLRYRDMLYRIAANERVRLSVLPLPFMTKLLNLAGKLTKNRLTGGMAQRMNQDMVFNSDEAKKDFGYTARKFLNGE